MVNLTTTMITHYLNTTVDPLLHNMTCDVPHDDTDKIYTYTLTSRFVAFSTFLSVCNFILALPTAAMNFLVVLSIIRTDDLLTNTNRLLLSICLADFFVGGVVEPIFGAHIIQVTQANHNCGLSNFLIYCVPVTIVITMITHMVISLERYFSVHYPKTYHKVFNKRIISGFTMFIWAACLLAFVIPLITGKVVLGTQIIVTLILISLIVCAYCYISIYQDYKQQHSRPKTQLRGTKVVRSVEKVERTPEEEENFKNNMKISMFVSKLFLCMLVIYILTLIKNVLNAYNVFPGNGYYNMHFTFDTLLFMNAFFNPAIVLYCSIDIFNAASMILRS